MIEAEKAQEQTAAASGALDRLAAFGRAGKGAIDIAGAALLLASLDRPQVPLERYRLHLDDLAAAVARAAGDNSSGESQVRALTGVIHGSEGYSGDADTYDDLQNANLMRVIDRRKGLPVALGILYLHAARAQGWLADGLAFPGHFLIALSRGPERVIVDPFAGAAIGGASALRGLLKKVSGPEAELTPACYAVLDDRHILLRLLNNAKTRLAAQGRFARAVAVIDRMLLIAPEETALYRDLGILQAEAGNLKAAVAALTIFVDRTQDEEARHIAAALAQKIAARLN
ncbi:MAG: hypothetical protein RL477_2124 [Pseudomonadota bacterium]|jgi:regulator of sirC expression with transglutaminase-like and TPR domain